jgi:hypothetical protein
MNKAVQLMNKMELSQNAKPNLVTYNTYMQCMMDSHNIQELERVFYLISDKDIISYSIYINALLNLSILHLLILYTFHK